MSIGSPRHWWTTMVTGKFNVRRPWANTVPHGWDISYYRYACWQSFYANSVIIWFRTHCFKVQQNTSYNIMYNMLIDTLVNYCVPRNYYSWAVLCYFRTGVAFRIVLETSSFYTMSRVRFKNTYKLKLSKSDHHILICC